MELSNIKPVAILCSYLCLAAVLTAQILRLLYQAKIRPQTQRQDPHHRPPKSAHLVIFATLAVVSLVITWYYMLAFFRLSYQTWARNNSLSLPTRLWRSDVLLARNEDVGGLHLGAWLRDTKLFKDAWETVIDGRVRFWWSQQIFLITTIWSVFLGVEGAGRVHPTRSKLTGQCSRQPTQDTALMDIYASRTDRCNLVCNELVISRRVILGSRIWGYEESTVRER